MAVEHNHEEFDFNITSSMALSETAKHELSMASNQTITLIILPNKKEVKIRIALLE